MAAAAVLALAATGSAAAAQTGEVEVQVRGLRNARGMVRLCMTRNPAFFPECNRDPQAVRRNVAPSHAGSIRFGGLAPGIWALAVMHDENGNGRLDRFAGIPREGFGFSRNPGLRMGPPRFSDVRFELGASPLRHQVRLRYLL